MKILLATDGMPRSWPAEELVAGIVWPRDTTIEALTVLREPEIDGISGEAREAMLATASLGADSHLRAFASRISAPGRQVGIATSIGRPASTIVAEAERLGVDLIVVGDVGRGTFVGSLLGSVAAEVVDHAPCPVLVARTARLARIVLADDGSPQAERAASVLETWPIFQGLDATVVSVAPLEGVLVAAGPVRHDDATERTATAIDATRVAWARTAHDRALRLESAGVHAREETRAGDPARQIVDVADTVGAHLVVMGSRGRTGIERFLLGSVARNVLIHAPCSVLIVR